MKFSHKKLIAWSCVVSVSIITATSFLSNFVTNHINNSQSNTISDTTYADDSSLDPSIRDEMDLNFNDFIKINGSNNNEIVSKNTFLNSNKMNSVNAVINSINKDIANFLYYVWISSQKELKLFDLIINNFSYNDKTKELDLSFNFNLINSNDEPKIYTINQKNYYIEANTKQNIEIIIQNKKIYFDLINYNEKVYLTWKVYDVILKIDNNEEIIKTFKFSNDLPSHLFPYLILNVSINNNYIDTFKNQDFSFIDERYLKYHVETNISNRLKFFFSLNKNMYGILNVLSKNPDIKQFLNESADYLSSLLVDLKIVDSSLSNFTKEILKSNIPLVDITNKYRYEIADFVEPFLPKDLINKDLLISVLSGMSSSMSQKDKQDILDILNDFLPQELLFVKNIIIYVMENKTTFELIEFTLTNYKYHILYLSGNDKTVKFILNLLTLLTRQENNQTIKILNLLCIDKYFIHNLISGLLTPVGSNWIIDFVINQLYGTNSNLTVINIQNLINNTLLPLLNYFSNIVNFTIEKGFTNNNLTLYNNIVSYDYFMNIRFDMDFKLNLIPLLNLLPNTIDIGIGFLIEADLIKTMFPKYFEFNSDDFIRLNFLANKQSIYFSPKLKNSTNNTYYYGISIPQTVKFRLDAPNTFYSIVNQYYYKNLFGISPPFLLIKSILETILLKEYEFEDQIQIVDETKEINDYDKSLYNGDYWFEWNKLDQKTIDDLFWLNVNVENKYKYYVETTYDNKFEMFRGDIYSKQPIISDVNKKVILEKLISISPEFNNVIHNFKPVFYINPIFYGDIQFINSDNAALIPLKEIKVSILFPFEVLNKETKTYSKYFTKTFKVNY